MSQLLSGTERLAGGYRFIWAQGRGDEISGFIEAPGGGIVPRSSGWWRTDDPQIAARAAGLVLRSLLRRARELPAQEADTNECPGE